jgi:drug/metabolite transporter (DMT)-like permease
MNPRNTSAWTLMVVLALIWGSSFILMKRGLESYTPYQIGAIRMLASFLCLTPFLWKALKKVPRSKWIFLFAAGWLGNGIPSILFPYAETHLNSALTGMLNSLTPLFAFVIGLSFFKMKISQNKIYGLIIGLIGACLLIAGGKTGDNRGDLVHAFAVILATICYGFSVNIIRSKLSEIDSVSNTAMVLMFTAIPMGASLFFTDFYSRTTTLPGAGSSLVYILILAIFGTALSTVLFNKLIKRSDALFASSVTYLIPIVAIMWGIADKEVLRPVHFLGLAGALIGVYLINKSVSEKRSADESANWRNGE